MEDHTPKYPQKVYDCIFRHGGNVLHSVPLMGLTKPVSIASLPWTNASSFNSGLVRPISGTECSTFPPWRKMQSYTFCGYFGV